MLSKECPECGDDMRLEQVLFDFMSEDTNGEPVTALVCQGCEHYEVDSEVFSFLLGDDFNF